MTATVHVAAACAGLVLGLLVLLQTKGTPRHRLVGGSYALALVVLNVAGLLTHQEAQFGVFHALAVVSLVTVLTGVTIIALGRPRPGAVISHAYFMTWSYAGLVAAGVGQLVAALVDGSRGVVLGAIGGVLVAAGVLIHRQVPRTLAARAA